MEANKSIYKLLSISPIYGHLCENGSECFLRSDKEALLFFVYSGKLTISYLDEYITLGKGEYAFVKRDIFTDIKKHGTGTQNFNGIYLGLDKYFLWDIHDDLSKQCKCCRSRNFENNLIKLSSNPYLQSLYISLGIYLDYGVNPSEDILQLKMFEAVYSLTLTDSRFYTCLFDFLYPHTIINILNNE